MFALSALQVGQPDFNALDKLKCSFSIFVGPDIF